MEISVYFKTYNAGGGHPTLSLIGDFLVQGAPSFGDELKEIEVTIHFRCPGPPRRTLEELFEKFHASIERLPKISYLRKKCKAEVSFYSELSTSLDLAKRQMDLVMFYGGCREVVKNIGLLQTRLSQGGHFDFSAFQQSLDKRLRELPSTLIELITISDEIKKQREAKRAALTEWEKLGVDFEDFHPNARLILDDPRLWDVCDEMSPNGSDTGADVLELYREWRKRHRTKIATDFFNSLMAEWEVTIPPDQSDEYSRHTYNQAIVGLAFAQVKLYSTCDRTIASLALTAVESQPEHDLTNKLISTLQGFI